MHEWHLQWLQEAFRVLQPGGVIKAFSGTRTFHRMASAMKAAGFADLRLEAWNYGSGFPKSLNVGKALDKAAGAEREILATVKTQPKFKYAGDGRLQEKWLDKDTKDITAPATEAAKRWDGWGTALKPSWEPVVVGRKPCE
jgi:site-specific DNA-methyltransferase (adenine-specific)